MGVWRLLTSALTRTVSLTVTARTRLAVSSTVTDSSASATWGGSWTGATPASSALTLGPVHLLGRLGVRGHRAITRGGCLSVRTVMLPMTISHPSTLLGQDCQVMLSQAILPPQ